MFYASYRHVHEGFPVGQGEGGVRRFYKESWSEVRLVLWAGGSKKFYFLQDAEWCRQETSQNDVSFTCTKQYFFTGKQRSHVHQGYPRKPCCSHRLLSPNFWLTVRTKDSLFSVDPVRFENGGQFKGGIFTALSRDQHMKRAVDSINSPTRSRYFRSHATANLRFYWCNGPSSLHRRYN